MINRFIDILSTLIGPVRTAELRNHISALWRWGFSVAGLYRPIPDRETEIKFEKQITFKGDTPLRIESGENEQGRLAFRLPRPLLENVVDLIVTPKGGSWQGGRFEERYSAGKPGLRLLLEDRRPDETLSEAYVVQCVHNDTYGDWVSEYLVPILRAAPLSAPLLLPLQVASKPHVARDLKALGIEWRAIEHAIKIENAFVLRQQKFFVHFPESEIQLLRQFFGKANVSPRPGGLVYLSRHAERSDIAARPYPSLAIEEMVKLRGGRIIRTYGATLEEYADAAIDAETVIFDHGSAIYNALGWPVGRAIEIASDTWWNNAFLMMANAAGIEDYTIIRSDLGVAHVRERLTQALDAPLDASAAT